jgi:hypothetical protein
MLQLIEEGTNDLRNCINNSIQMLVNNKQQAMIGILVWQVVLIGLIYMHHMRNVISMSMMVNFIFYRRLGGFQVVLDHLTCGCSGGWVTSSMAWGRCAASYNVQTQVWQQHYYHQFKTSIQNPF